MPPSDDKRPCRADCTDWCCSPLRRRNAPSNRPDPTMGSREEGQFQTRTRPVEEQKSRDSGVAPRTPPSTTTTNALKRTTSIQRHMNTTTSRLPMAKTSTLNRRNDDKDVPSTRLRKALEQEYEQQNSSVAFANNDSSPYSSSSSMKNIEEAMTAQMSKAEKFSHELDATASRLLSQTTTLPPLPLGLHEPYKEDPLITQAQSDYHRFSMERRHQEIGVRLAGLDSRISRLQQIVDFVRRELLDGLPYPLGFLDRYTTLNEEMLRARDKMDTLAAEMTDVLHCHKNAFDRMDRHMIQRHAMTLNALGKAASGMKGRVEMMTEIIQTLRQNVSSLVTERHVKVAMRNMNQEKENWERKEKREREKKATEDIIRRGVQEKERRERREARERKKMREEARVTKERKELEMLEEEKKMIEEEKKMIELLKDLEISQDGLERRAGMDMNSRISEGRATELVNHDRESYKKMADVNYQITLLPYPVNEVAMRCKEEEDRVKNEDLERLSLIREAFTRPLAFRPKPKTAGTPPVENKPSTSQPSLLWTPKSGASPKPFVPLRSRSPGPLQPVAQTAPMNASPTSDSDVSVTEHLPSPVIPVEVLSLPLCRDTESTGSQETLPIQEPRALTQDLSSLWPTVPIRSSYQPPVDYESLDESWSVEPSPSESPMVFPHETNTDLGDDWPVVPFPSERKTEPDQYLTPPRSPMNPPEFYAALAEKHPRAESSPSEGSGTSLNGISDCPSGHYNAYVARRQRENQGAKFRLEPLWPMPDIEVEGIVEHDLVDVPLSPPRAGDEGGMGEWDMGGEEDEETDEEGDGDEGEEQEEDGEDDEAEGEEDWDPEECDREEWQVATARQNPRGFVSTTWVLDVLSELWSDRHVRR
ncbi:hypothetical protein P154DRAFT_562284 [Amniculicola lignicola CBS 123094]|uniref:Uncharacterized protein n=1 Tax=Amniculicola lignicola CBS 123094 TaxID=1392246 RepID=A0A6A5WK64_9PLEO|nr:hypothetical protein P154DRAFT_562284 [Amniculicola lignicola CBS 123094]